MSNVTGEQIRAARAALGWSMQSLAEVSGVSFSTIRRVESPNGTQSTTQANMRALISALEAAGIEFFEADDGAPGIVIRDASRR